MWGQRYIDDLTLRDRSAGGTLNERLYATQDANWNVTALADTTGTIQQRFAYDPYGTTTVLTPVFTTTTDAFDWETTFCGYRFDTISKLYECRFRFYAGLLGSWITRDPAEYFAGLNLFLYIGSMPISGTDPLGLRDPSAPVVNDPTDTGNCDSGKYRPYKLPSADLVCIDASKFKETSRGPTTEIDGFLRSARLAYPAATPIRNLDEVIRAAREGFKANGSEPITLIIVGHGATAQFNLGSGYLADPGRDAPASQDMGQVLDLRPRSQKTRERFPKELSPFVRQVRFISCCTGRNDPRKRLTEAQGTDLLEKLSSDTMEVLAPTKKCSFRRKADGSWQLWMNGNARWESRGGDK